MFKRGLILGLVLLLAVSLVFGISAGKSHINTDYNTGEFLSGGINVSFNNDLASGRLDAVFSRDDGYSKESFSKQTLKQVLDQNAIAYTCNPSNCFDDYSMFDASSDKSIVINNGEKIIGFKMTGNNVQFQGLSFSIDASNPPNCRSPLQIDLFDDGIIDWQATKMTEDYSCYTGTGCFSSTAASEDAVITTEPYCELISLPASQKYSLEAWVKKGSDEWSDGMLQMYLYSSDGSELGSCDLPEPSINGGIVSCAVELDYQNTERQEYYVCVSSAEDVTGYKTKTESSGKICGIATYPSYGIEATNDFYISAKTPTFDNIGTLTEEDFEDINGQVGTYLDMLYAGNCSAGCKIPVRFISNSSANVRVYDSNLLYRTTVTKSEDKIYSADKIPLKLTTAKKSMIDLGAFGVKVPGSAGDYSMDLYFGSELVDQADISVESFNPLFGVYPTIAVLKIPTNFIAVLRDKNVSALMYTWDFGDGSSLETFENKASHSYNSSGTYRVSVKMTTLKGNASAESDVGVASARDSVSIAINRYEDRLAKLESQIKILPSWVQPGVQNNLGLTTLPSKIASAKQGYQRASSDEQYVAILNDLAGIRVPSSLEIYRPTSVQYFVDYNLIDADKLSVLGAGTSANAANIGAWMNTNVDLSLEYRKITAVYDEGREAFGVLATLTITPKQEGNKTFLVIEGDSSFKEQATNMNGSFGIAYDTLSQRSVEFLNYGAESFSDVIIYMSPEFSVLGGAVSVECNIDGVCSEGETAENCPEDCRSIWSRAIMIVVLIILLGAGAAFGLLWWYKRNYENRLFKERTDLFNIMNFIRAAKAQNILRKEIYSKLKGQGWSSEQISYGFMQVEGSFYAKLIGRKNF